MASANSVAIRVVVEGSAPGCAAYGRGPWMPEGQLSIVEGGRESSPRDPAVCNLARILIMAKRSPAPDWSSYRKLERAVRSFPAAGQHRLALAYANTYHVGMSSLAFQRVYELVQYREGWSCERFFADGQGRPLSVESGAPLSAFGCVAFSILRRVMSLSSITSLLSC